MQYSKSRVCLRPIVLTLRKENKWYFSYTFSYIHLTNYKLQEVIVSRHKMKTLNLYFYRNRDLQPSDCNFQWSFEWKKTLLMTIFPPSLMLSSIYNNRIISGVRYLNNFIGSRFGHVKTRYFCLFTKFSLFHVGFSSSPTEDHRPNLAVCFTTSSYPISYNYIF